MRESGISERELTSGKKKEMEKDERGFESDGALVPRQACSPRPVSGFMCKGMHSLA